ncbi:MAG: DUF6242 domain-containing protein [Tannerellaceae bacterium]|jgi:hypothetical protein|nr:DUF6242 domain-containing protein [Tannerellaceae bacterium]
MKKELNEKKTRILFAGLPLWMFLLASCLGGSEEEYEVEIPKDCQIGVFTLSHDSIVALGKAKFTIDQVNGEIFNIDSLPCGTEIGKVACAIQTVNVYAVSQVRIVQSATGDTVTLKSKTESSAVKWTAEDSIDFSQPVEIILSGIDGVASKSYEAKVNIHQQEPEELVWTLWADDLTGIEQLTKYNEKYYRVSKAGLEVGLYSSLNGMEWASVSGGESWRYLLGSIEGSARQSSFLAGISQTPEGEVFVYLNEDNFEEGDAVPASFPRTGFGKVNYTSMHYNYLLLVGGRGEDGKLSSDCWSTSDGKVWVNQTEHNGSGFSAREGSVVVNYDNRLWLFGGQTENGGSDIILTDIYISYDRGINWTPPPPEVTSTPSEFFPPPFASVSLSSDSSYFLLLAPPDKVWRGGINRLLW